MMGPWLCFSLFVLLLVTPSDSSDVVGHDVQVTAGGDVILPWHLDPPFDVSTLTVHWKRNDVTVHAYRNRADYYDDQDQQFRGRTSLFHSELTRGNISLKLTNVTEDDSGLYICYVPRLESQVKRGNVNLTINPQTDPGGRGGDKETPGGDEPTEDDRTGVIAGSVAATAALVLITVLAVIYFKRRRRNNKEPQRDDREMDHLDPPHTVPGTEPYVDPVVDP